MLHCRCLMSVLFLYVFLSLFCGRALAAVPNSHFRVFGQGWECDRGFHNQDGRCAPVIVPANGQLNTFGNSWECKKGYVQHGNVCELFRIPDNAGMDTFGNWWRCNRGYYRNGNECFTVKIPEHGLLDSNGNDWECEDGFKKQDTVCVNMTPSEKEEQENKRRQEVENEQDFVRMQESSGKTIERPPCLAAYNKCTSACSVSINDRSTGQVLTNSKFGFKCSEVCLKAQSRCEEDRSKGQCDVFVSVCRESCSDLGQGLQDTNSRSVCEGACASGKDRCVYQAQRLEAPVK
jgi:hypothetical protein